MYSVYEIGCASCGKVPSYSFSPFNEIIYLSFTSTVPSYQIFKEWGSFTDTSIMFSLFIIQTKSKVPISSGKSVFKWSGSL